MSVSGLKKAILGLIFICLFIPDAGFADAAIQQPSFRKIDEKVQLVKKNIIKLGHDFALLEEGVASYSTKEFVVYIALAVSEGFTLQAVELTLNDEFAARYEMSNEVVKSLLLGGVKRIYTANLSPGTYKLEAKLIGKVGKRHEYTNSIVVKIDKNKSPKTVELKVTNIREKFLPEFSVSEWDY